MDPPSYVAAPVPTISSPGFPPVPSAAGLSVPGATALTVPGTVCPPAARWGTPVRDAHRRMTPDVSGMYEQLTSGSSRPMTVQVSMAGQAIVGWFSLPPGKASGSCSVQSWPATPPVPPLVAGSFVVDTRSVGPSGDYTMWWQTGQGRPADANSTDPHLLLASLVAGQLCAYGGFAIADGSQPGAVITLRFNAGAQRADRFTRYRASCRLPGTVIAGVTDQKAAALLLVEQVQPLAPRWVAQLVEQVTGSNLQGLLTAWQLEATSPPAARRARRTAVTNSIIMAELEPGYLPEPHQRALRTRLTAALKSTQLTIGPFTYPLWDWYSLLAAEEQQDSHPPELDPFTRLGLTVSSAKGFAYIMSYLKAKKEFKALVKGAVAGFSLHVRKVPVEFLLDPNGARKVDGDGTPQVVNPAVLTDPKAGTNFGGDGDLLVGGFVDVGVGLGLSIDSGLSRSDSAPTAKRKDLGGDSLGTVTFYSSADLRSEAFEGAWFTIATLKGPSAKVGNWVGFTAFSTTFHQFWLANNVVLNAVVTDTLAWKPPTMPSWDLLFGGVSGIKSYIEGWVKGNASATLFEISEGFGYVTHLSGGLPAPRPTGGSVMPDYSPVQGAEAGIVLFAVDSAQFRVGGDITQDGRYLLDASLATMRPLLTAGPDRVINIDGYTSPEQTRCYNQALSEARADFVGQAVLDAFGTAIPGTNVAGRGEQPSLQSGTGLQNPPDDPGGLAAFIAANPGQVAKWPEWRKAEISVQGSVVVIGTTATPPSRTPPPP